MPTYLVISNRVKAPEDVAKHREMHNEYMRKLKEQGKLEMGCRFTDGKGGFYILNASSLEEAEMLASDDPYHANRVREYTMKEFEKRL